MAVSYTHLDVYKRQAYTYLRNEEDALDIVQESVYKAIKYSGRVRQEAHIRTWLWRIVMNTAVDFIRKSSREIATDETQETVKEDIYQDFDTLESLNILDERDVYKRQAMDSVALAKRAHSMGDMPSESA